MILVLLCPPGAAVMPVMSSSDNDIQNLYLNGKPIYFVSRKCCIGDETVGVLAEILDTKSFYEIVKGHIY